VNILAKTFVEYNTYNIRILSRRSLYDFSEAADHSQLDDFEAKHGHT